MSQHYGVSVPKTNSKYMTHFGGQLLMRYFLLWFGHTAQKQYSLYALIIEKHIQTFGIWTHF